MGVGTGLRTNLASTSGVDLVEALGEPDHRDDG